MFRHVVVLLVDRAKGQIVAQRCRVCDLPRLGSQAIALWLEERKGVEELDGRQFDCPVLVRGSIYTLPDDPCHVTFHPPQRSFIVYIAGWNGQPHPKVPAAVLIDAGYVVHVNEHRLTEAPSPGQVVISNARHHLVLAPPETHGDLVFPAERRERLFTADSVVLEVLRRAVNRLADEEENAGGIKISNTARHANLLAAAVCLENRSHLAAERYGLPVELSLLFPRSQIESSARHIQATFEGLGWEIDVKNHLARTPKGRRIPCAPMP